MPFGKRLLTRLICCLLLASTAISADDSAPARSWDELVKADEAAILKLRDLQAKYQTADTDGKIEILEDYQTTIADLQSNIIPALEKLLPGKLATAEQDLKVQRIASQVVQFALDDNRFSDAKTLAEQILKTNPDDPHATNIVGIAQFADHDFAGAIKTLSEAKEKKILSPEMGGRYLDFARKYVDYWKTEQEIRDKEARLEGDEQLPRVKLETSKGEIVLELFENEAPNTVANFVNLVEKKYYDGLKFHRVIPGFMAQGGCPHSRDGDPGTPGTGGPGYNISCECYRPDARRHFAGSLSMAHAGRDTGGSQFFITHLPTPHLDKEVSPQSVHTVFGRVVEGLDVARDLEVDDKIQSATVLRKRDHEYVPKTQPEF